jgi:hypothetical protein
MKNKINNIIDFEIRNNKINKQNSNAEIWRHELFLSSYNENYRLFGFQYLGVMYPEIPDLVWGWYVKKGIKEFVFVKEFLVDYDGSLFEMEKPMKQFHADIVDGTPPGFIHSEPEFSNLRALGYFPKYRD